MSREAHAALRDVKKGNASRSAASAARQAMATFHVCLLMLFSSFSTLTVETVPGYFTSPDVEHRPLAGAADRFAIDLAIGYPHLRCMPYFRSQ